MPAALEKPNVLEVLRGVAETLAPVGQCLVIIGRVLEPRALPELAETLEPAAPAIAATPLAALERPRSPHDFDCRHGACFGCCVVCRPDDSEHTVDDAELVV